MGYLQKHPYPDFKCGTEVYSLLHLNEYIRAFSDTKGVLHPTIITFEDHCFTKEFENGDDPLYAYPSATRKRGQFCVIRYRYSLDIRAHLDQAKEAWFLDNGSVFAFVPAVDYDSTCILYGIIFVIRRVTGLQPLSISG